MKIRWSEIFAVLWLLAGMILHAQHNLQETVKTDTVTPQQNLFDASHTQQFADFLFRSGEYDFAVEEYERLVFLQPYDYAPKKGLLKSFRQMKQYDKALVFFEKFFPVIDTIPVDFQKEGIVLNVLEGYYPTALDWLEHSKLDTLDKQIFVLGILALQKKWKKSLDFYRAHENHPGAIYHQFGNAVRRRTAQKNKSPLLAGTLSAFVPGLGKVYTKNYGDALMSFIIVGLNAWQAWRGFSKNGIRSAHGWIFAGIGTSFYLGNIWGSTKAAKRYNKKLDDEATDEIKAVFEYGF